MFFIDGKSTKDSGWCITPQNSNLTIMFGSNSVSYVDQGYKDMLDQLGSISVVHDRHTHWVYLLGKALREAVPTEKPDDYYEISEVAPFLVKYCSLLTGKECVAVDGKSATADPIAGIIEESRETVSTEDTSLFVFELTRSRFHFSLSLLSSRTSIMGLHIAGVSTRSKRPRSSKVGMLPLEIPPHGCPNGISGTTKLAKVKFSIGLFKRRLTYR